MGALRLGHVPEVAPDLDGAKPSARRNFRTESAASVSRIINRPEKEQRRAIFCELLKTRRGAAADVARAWEVNEAVVRKVREGTATLTDERLLALPPSMRAFFDEQLAGPIQLRLPSL